MKDKYGNGIKFREKGYAWSFYPLYEEGAKIILAEDSETYELNLSYISEKSSKWEKINDSIFHSKEKKKITINDHDL